MIAANADPASVRPRKLEKTLRQAVLNVFLPWSAQPELTSPFTLDGPIKIERGQVTLGIKHNRSGNAFEIDETRVGRHDIDYSVEAIDN